MLNANLLRAAMAKVGCTQGQLAQKLDMSYNTLSTRMTGQTSFNVDEIDKMVDILSINSANEVCDIFLSTSSLNRDREE